MLNSQKIVTSALIDKLPNEPAVNLKGINGASTITKLTPNKLEQKLGWSETLVDYEDQSIEGRKLKYHLTHKSYHIQHEFQWV